MGLVKQIITADEARFLAAHRRMVEAQLKVVDGNKKIRRDSQKTDGTIKKLGDNTVGYMKNIVTSMIGPAGVVAAFAMIRNQAQETIQALDSLAQSAEAFDKATLAVANQEGVAQTAAGQRRAAEVLMEIQRAGRFGEDWEKAKSINIAGHVALGKKGQVLTGMELEMVKTGAALAGYKQLGAEEAGAMFKVLAQAGATKTKETLNKRMLQFFATYEKALSTNASATIGGMSGFVGDIMAVGIPYELALANYVQAVKTTSSESEAATRVSQMVRLMLNPKITSAMAEDLKVKPETIMGMDKGQRFQEFGRWVSRHAGDEAYLQKSGLANRQILWALGMYKGAALQNINTTRKMLETVKSSELLQELRNYENTPLALMHDIATEKAILGAKTTLATKVGAEFMQYAATKNKIDIERGDTSAFRSSIDRYLLPERAETERTARHILRQKLDAIYDYVLQGKISNLQWSAASKEVMDLYSSYELPGMPLFNQKELGEAVLAINKLEIALRELTPAIKKNTDTMGGQRQIDVDAQN